MLHQMIAIRDRLLKLAQYQDNRNIEIDRDWLRFGLCHHIQTVCNYSEKGTALQYINQRMSEWPEHSGDSTFPIPSTLPSEQAYKKASKMFTMYSGQYGASRKRLAFFLIQQINSWITVNVNTYITEYLADMLDMYLKCPTTTGLCGYMSEHIYGVFGPCTIEVNGHECLSYSDPYQTRMGAITSVRIMFEQVFKKVIFSWDGYSGDETFPVSGGSYNPQTIYNKFVFTHGMHTGHYGELRLELARNLTQYLRTAPSMLHPTYDPLDRWLLQADGCPNVSYPTRSLARRAKQAYANSTSQVKYNLRDMKQSQ